MLILVTYIKNLQRMKVGDSYGLGPDVEDVKIDVGQIVEERDANNIPNI